MTDGETAEPAQAPEGAQSAEPAAETPVTDPPAQETEQKGE